MDHRLIEGLMEAIAPLIKTYVDERLAKEVTPLRAKLAEYEGFTPLYFEGLVNKNIPSFVDHSSDLANLKVEIAQLSERQVKDGQDGKDADPEAIKAAVLDVVAQILPGEVSAAVEKIEKPADGKDADPAHVEMLVRLIVGEEVGKIERPVDGKDGVDGKSVTLDEIAPLIETAVASEFATIVIPDPVQGPPGEAGKSVTADDVRPLLEQLVAAIELPVPENGKDGRDGKDGIGLAGALLGRSGDLVLTLSDGTANSLGIIVGKDGEPGVAGKDGMDGLGFDDLEIIHDGERTFTFRYQRGDQVKEQVFTVPAVLDRGVFKEGREQPYEKGDGVTFGGSFWIAQRDAPEGKPGDGSSGWRLGVKKGRDGKDGIVRTLPPQGPVKA